MDYLAMLLLRVMLWWLKCAVSSTARMHNSQIFGDGEGAARNHSPDLQLLPSPTPRRGGGGGGTQPEVCPLCGARFESVERLVAHVEDFHPNRGSDPPQGTVVGAAGRRTTSNGGVGGGVMVNNPLSAAAAGARSPPRAEQQPLGGGGGGVGDTFACPHCGLRFGDAVALLGHAEACGVEQQRRAVLAGGGGARAAAANGGGGRGASKPKSSTADCSIQ